MRSWAGQMERIPPWNTSPVSRLQRLSEFSLPQIRTDTTLGRRATNLAGPSNQSSLTRIPPLSAYRRSSSNYKEQQYEPDAPVVEEGRFAYEVSSCINQISALAPRGSIARCMAAFKGKLSEQDFSDIFREFSQRGDWPRALRLFKYMLRHEWCKPTEHIYTIMIGVLGREGLLDRASELFESMPEYGVDWNVYSFTALINAFGRNGQYEVSLQLLARMKRLGVVANLITYNTVISAGAKGGLPWEGLIDLFAQMRHDGIQPDIVTYNQLLNTCAQRGLVEEAGMVFRTLNEAGVKPNEMSYRALVAAFQEGGEDGLLEVEGLLEEMAEEEGEVAEVEGYNTLIHAYRVEGNHGGASRVLKQMQVVGCPPSVDTYSMLLDVYGQNGRYAEVRQLFVEMKEQGLAPNLPTYTTLIQVFGEGGFPREAVSLFGDLTEGGLECDLDAYEALLYACGRGGLQEKATEVVRSMQRRGLTPSPSMYTSLIYAYGRCANYEEAQGAFGGIQEKGGTLDLDAYNALLDVYAKGGLAAQAAQLATALMESRDADPDSHTLEFLVEGLGRAGAFEQAIELYEDMVSSARPPELGLQAAVAAVYCWAGRVEEGRAQLLEMEEQQMVPPVATFCHLIGAFARAGRGEEVGRAVEEMGRYTMPASHRMVAGIMRGEMEGGHSWQRVEYFLDEMKVEGMGENMVLYNALLEALWALGLQDRACRVLGAGRIRGEFPEAVQQSDNVWALDLHRFSPGGACAMMMTWLKEARELMEEGTTLPQIVTIVTKWGEQGQTAEGLKDIPTRKAVYSLLLTLQSPFRTAPWNFGRTVCSGADLEKWLLSDGMRDRLQLSDREVNFEAPRRVGRTRERDTSEVGSRARGRRVGS